jgi:NAD(P)H-dependent FMN reductase
VADRARSQGRFDRIEVLDLAEIALPFLDEPHHPRLGKYTKPHTFAWSRAVDEADAFVIVVPEYNGGFPAALKNALDYLHAEWHEKPVGVVTYGGGPGGGAGAGSMLVPVTRALGLVTTGHGVSIGGAPRLVVDGEFLATPAIEQATDNMLDEVADLDADLGPRRAALLAAS